MKHILIILGISFCCLFSAQAQTRQPDIKVVNVYPNPASSYINFEFYEESKISNYSLRIFNFIGKKVYENNFLSRRTVINLGDFFRGYYTYQLVDRNGFVISGAKFQVAR